MSHENESTEALIASIGKLKKEVDKSVNSSKNRTLDPIPDDDRSGGGGRREKKLRTNANRGAKTVYSAPTKY